MTGPPFQAGDFVWCAFPETEHPVRPGPLHLTYTLAVAGTSQLSALSAYTTSQPWLGSPMPPGVRAFDRQEAAALGQARPFVMDLRRLAYVPVTPAWFPKLEQPDGGIQGHAPKALQRQLMQTATELLTRRSEIVEHLGPLWPRGQR